MAGPLWLGNLHDKEFIKKVIEYIKPKTELE
jgi:tRNA G26 N,N-dimethylase Trm1